MMHNAMHRKGEPHTLAPPIECLEHAGSGSEGSPSLPWNDGA